MEVCKPLICRGFEKRYEGGGLFQRRGGQLARQTGFRGNVRTPRPSGRFIGQVIPLDIRLWLRRGEAQRKDRLLAKARADGGLGKEQVQHSGEAETGQTGPSAAPVVSDENGSLYLLEFDPNKSESNAK